MISSLLHYPDFDEKQVLLDNYAESFLQMASHPYKQSHFNTALKDTARQFRNLLVHRDEESQNIGLQRIQSDWTQFD